MDAHNLRLIVWDERRESLHVPVRRKRETERQSCLEEMHDKTETETW